MTSYNKKISEKLSKLSATQVVKLFEDLSEENEMLYSILESLSTGLIIIDSHWKVLLANKSAARYFSFSVHPEELPGENLRLWELIKDEDIADFLKECDEKKHPNVSKEFTIENSVGSIRFITVSVVPFVRQDALDGQIVIVRDITEKRNQEILLHRMESLEGLTNLAASVAHEVKNPLGAISIHIQLLQKSIKNARAKDGNLPDEKFMEKYLDVVNEEIENLNKIIMDFLFAVRPVSVSLELLEPDKLIEKFHEFFKPEFSDKNIDFLLSLDGKSTRILLDEKLFREVILNLTQNALQAIEQKYDSDGMSEKGVVEIKTGLKNDRFIILIKDNGIGMSEKTASKIFEPYYTTKANGTGLGMTMVYKIIKEFSGDINLESVEGKGTCFIISLPVPQTDTLLIGNNEHEGKK